MPRLASVVVPSYIQDRVQNRLSALHDIAVNAYRDKTIKLPEVRYDVTGRVAGYAHTDRLVRFNSILLMENTDDFIERTVRHEFAHCVDFTINGNCYQRSSTGNRWSVHGKSWQNVMRVLGDKYPTRCHSYDTFNASGSKTRFVYICPTCNTPIRLSRVIHERIQSRNQRRYHRCGRGETASQPIIFSHEISVHESRNQLFHNAFT